MTDKTEYSVEFDNCVHFHGHSCPGLAIGFAAAQAARKRLNVGSAEDEEIVAIVENDSCAVDAIQVILGCTFGKGNLIFRDWGKQVYTVIERKSGRSVRLSFTGELPLRSERHALKQKISAGQATDADKQRWEELRELTVQEMLAMDPEKLFEVREVVPDMPPLASIVDTQACSICGEQTMSTRLLPKEAGAVCRGCAKE
jgi:formylmethanofuran dehydrogenase subunit E